MLCTSLVYFTGAMPANQATDSTLINPVDPMETPPAPLNAVFFVPLGGNDCGPNKMFIKGKCRPVIWFSLWIFVGAGMSNSKFN